MSYDIYGNYLRGGYCEVHPDVPESYPCSECMYEQQYYEEQKSQEEQYYRYLEELKYEHWQSITRDEWTDYIRARVSEID